MQAINLNSLGVKLGYAIETTAGTRPTTNYIRIPGVKSTPSFNIEPASHQSTTLEETQFHTYVAGLKDIGGALPFGFNLTEALMDLWEEHVDDSELAAQSGRRTWYHVNIPGLTRGFFFAGTPSELGLPEIAVDGVLETEVFVTPTAIHGFDTKAPIVDAP